MGVRTICGIAIVCGVGEVTAGVVSLENGASVGEVTVASDDFGAYGQGLSPQNNDAYAPMGEQPFSATQLAGMFLFVETPDGKRSATLLAADVSWKRLVEPAEGNQADGLDRSEHTGLERVVTIQNAATSSSSSHSAFTVGDPTASPAWQLTFDLTQSLTLDFPTTDLVQTYVVTNTGQTSVEIVFNAHWDASLIWNTGFPADIVGVGTGLCYVYTRDNEDVAVQAVSLADGGSTVAVSSYYGGKEGLEPAGGPPAYTVKDDLIFTSFGVPVTWRNHIAEVGYDVAGESSTVEADPMMGLEWRFTLAMGATETIVVRRVYGTSSLLCPGGMNCGDGIVDLADGELCDDMVDTADCNALSCTPPVCGDGYPNAMAGEDCESGGVDTDSADCDSDCTFVECLDGHVNAVAGEACDDGVETDTCNANCQPAMCGDGYVNVAAREECEDGELCDLATCSYDFELGGGCAGCTTRSGDASWILAVLALGFAMRRRRYN